MFPSGLLFVILPDYRHSIKHTNVAKNSTANSVAKPNTIATVTTAATGARIKPSAAVTIVPITPTKIAVRYLGKHPHFPSQETPVA